ncbi:hypothetical protein [Nocardioides sp. 1609]|uniref:DUF6891 domain-containing protein n=1 Tax=Nocardioides sp. 1609 TaxID=2508327 RepID=UPI00106F9A2F|nr:hypothetical protein [Nocardioides sp. 1609]
MTPATNPADRSGAGSSASHPHASFVTPVPPDETTFAGDLMLKVAGGLQDRADLVDGLEDLIVNDDFGAVFPDDGEPSLDEAEELLDQVIAEHDAVVPAPSAGILAFDAAVDQLEAGGIAYSLGVGFDAGEAAQDGYERALRMAGESAVPARGYAYSHTQDVDRAVLTGRLTVGFSGMSGALDDEAAGVARAVAAAFADAGLVVDWDGDPGHRIVVAVRWERPFDRS